MRKIILFFFVLNSSLYSQEYKIPPDVIKSLIDANPPPSLNLNNQGTFGLILNRDGYQSISDLAILSHIRRSDSLKASLFNIKVEMS